MTMRFPRLFRIGTVAAVAVAANAVAAGAVAFRTLPPPALASGDSGIPFTGARFARSPEWDVHNVFSDGLGVCWRVYNGELPHDGFLYVNGECDGYIFAVDGESWVSGIEGPDTVRTIASNSVFRLFLVPVGAPRHSSWDRLESAVKLAVDSDPGWKAGCAEAFSQIYAATNATPPCFPGTGSRRCGCWKASPWSMPRNGTTQMR